jgi:dipeptidyl aminopeptidase/acylaminoacyl peptidase
MTIVLKHSPRRLLGRTSVAVLLLLAPAGLRGQAVSGLTPQQVAQTEFVTSAAISPDGRYVAFTVAVPADPVTENSPVSNHLHLLDRQSGTTAPLYRGASVASVAFRPGHRSVTFLATAEAGAPRSVYEIPLAGGAPRRLVAFDRPVLSYSWAPDGNRLAFVANEAVRPPASPLPYRPVFYEENLPQRRAYLVDVAAGQPPREFRLPGSYYQIVWSPDGARLAVSIAPTPTVDDSFMEQSISILDAGTLELVAEIQNRGKLGQIRWSPDGRRLALRAAHDINDPIDGRILVVDATGGTPRNILPGFEGKFEDLDWTGPNEIHFIASRGVESVFGRVRPDGTRLEPLMTGHGLALASFHRATGGRTAFVGSSPRHPAELFVLEPRQRTPQRITDSNPWLAAVALGEQRVVRHTPRDGAFELEGLLILPVGYVEGTRVPVITTVHGGPEAHYLNGWLTGYNLPGQMAAARGYAVFYPNYRGSTGRGRAFAMSSQADAGGKEFDDIVDGVDHLIELGIADGARVGVTGGSYGGYATAWMSTYYSERFAAGVMFIGISNNISKWGTSDIPNELYHVHSREWLWDGNNWQKYLERSPIYHVGRARTPLLIMHGADDTRVHPGQALELYRHMVVRRPEVPVRLILYPGEGHGNTRSASRLDYNLRMLEWFDAFLQGDGGVPSLDLPGVVR